MEVISLIINLLILVLFVIDIIENYKRKRFYEGLIKLLKEKDKGE